MFTKVNDLSTETIYSECCGLPLKITQGKNVTTFTYDGGLTDFKVSTRGEAVYLKYHDKLKKLLMSKITKEKPTLIILKKVTQTS